MISNEIIGAAKIKVVGVGGGGCNAITRMYKERLVGVDFLALNTDAQSLLGLDIPTSIRIGEKLTKGKVWVETHQKELLRQKNQRLRYNNTSLELI